MANHIIVPLDGSPLAEQALPLAVSLAQKTGDSILLLRVVAPPSAAQQEAQGEAALEKSISLRNNAMRQYFRTVEPDLQKMGVTVESRVEEGVPADTIVAVADALPARYVVMTTHGRTGFGRWTIGSVADRVMRQLDCPLILLRPKEPFVTALGPAVPIRTILVPLDGSPLADGVLPAAQDVAQQFGATLHLYHVIDPMPFLLTEMESPRVRAPVREAERRAAQAHLDRVARHLTRAGLTVETSLGDGQAADAILQFANDAGVDLIAMATHARAGLGRALLGSVTDRVIRAGELPVLIVRPE